VSKGDIPLKADGERHSDIALTLIKAFTAPLSQSDEARLSVLCRSLPDETGSGMITYPGRFARLDDVIEREIEGNFGARPVRIREMAASNAITSLELFERLKGREGGISVYATDFFDAVIVVPVAGWVVVFDAERRPIQFVGKRLVIPANGGIRRRYWFNRLLRKWLVARVLPKAVEGAQLLSSQWMSLFHPRCLAMAQSDSHFKLGRESILSPDDAACDVLRVMNLRPLDLTAACKLIADKGLLIVGNCFKPSDPLDATVFRRRADCFEVLRDLGAGFPGKQTILEMRLAEPRSAATM